ncbi:MAG: ABC transporter ATP-binding protein [Bacteroidota bacterium]
MQTSSSKALWRQLYDYALPYQRSFWLGSLLATTGSILWLLIPWAIGEIISLAAGISEQEDLSNLWYYLVILGGVSILYYTAQELARYLIYVVAERASIDLQTNTLAHMSRLDLSWHEAENSGNKLKKINRGGKSLNSMLRMYVDITIDAVVGLIGVAIVFATMSWTLNLLLIIFFITHYLLSSYLTRNATAQARKVNLVEEEFSGLKFEMLNSIQTVKTMAMLPALMRFIHGVTERLVKALSKRITLFRIRLAALGFNQQFFRIGIIAYSVWEVAQGNFEVGVIAQVFFYFSKIEVSAQRFSDIYHRYILAQIDLDGVAAIMQTEALIESQGAQSFPANWQEIQLRDLRFAYGDLLVLQGLNLSVRRGEKLGLVGVSGGGKSTLFKLLLKLYDEYEGFIGVDGISLRDIKRESLVQNLGVVLQDTELFDLSLKENILLGGEPLQAEEKLVYAADTARVSQFAAQHPHGMDTLVGEKGIHLSGGEKQRVGLARALYRKPEILFLDEATSHLDAESESLIQAALDELLEDVTAIVAAHRLSTLRKMDRIVVIDAGRIVEEGTFAELQKNKGVFWRLWEAGKD